MKKYLITYKDSVGLNDTDNGTSEIIEADAMVITQTGAVMFVEQPAIQRGQPSPQGEIIMIVSQYKKVERLDKTLVA